MVVIGWYSIRLTTTENGTYARLIDIQKNVTYDLGKYRLIGAPAASYLAMLYIIKVAKTLEQFSKLQAVNQVLDLYSPVYLKTMINNQRQE